MEDSSLAFEDIERLVLERHDTLSELNLQVLGLSQGRLYHSHGDKVLTSRGNTCSERYTTSSQYLLNS